MLGFVQRNVGYSVSNPRKLPSVRRAMRKHKKENPDCAFCGRTLGTHVHHKLPVKFYPELAGSSNNLMTLCGGGDCHLIVGHMGSWQTYNENPDATCKAAQLVK